jgi:hypothetical protein
MMIPKQFVIRDQRRVGYFTVDNEVVDNYGAKIGAYGVAVYCVIGRHSRNAVASLSQRDIATSLGISQDRVRKSLSDLAEFCLIRVDVPERPSPGVISTITLGDVKTTERHTFSSAPELNATRSRNKEVKTKTETETQLPPTPLREGGVSSVWQEVCEYLKDDLSTAYVNNPHFQESAYDKYFRGAWLVEIRGGVAVLDSPQPEILQEGIEKFQSRLRETFRAVVYDVREIRLKRSEPLLWEGKASA